MRVQQISFAWIEDHVAAFVIQLSDGQNHGAFKQLLFEFFGNHSARGRLEGQRRKPSSIDLVFATSYCENSWRLAHEDQGLNHQHADNGYQKQSEGQAVSPPKSLRLGARC